MKKTDIIVIGAGTAGLTAAIYGQRAGRHVLLLEEGMYGGQIVNTPEIENYPGIAQISGAQFAMKLYEQATALGAELETGKVVEIVEQEASKIVGTETMEYRSGAVIIATGAKNRKLGIEGEEALIGRGISYCAACDGAFYKDKVAAVVGGGNTALGDADYLANGCKQVYLIHRREEFRGDASMVERLKQRKNVTCILNAVVTGCQAGERLEKITVENVVSKEKQELSVDGLFVAIGQMPENQAFANLIRLDSQGYIIAGEDCRTNIPGIYAAGDCRTKVVRQLTTAAADGAVAALAACEYLAQRQ
ncbi:MAG: FAD-dependent oxidoreductase [Bacteroides sp.]|nr:FAD-dependent oxidoreductase [Bacteroides sp.]MCM1548769.1 FAD-dependent oxidoreductase [Clostridium sp.]